MYAEGVIKNKPKSFQEDLTDKPEGIFPDLYWIWEAYCILSEQRGVGPNGPVPITVTDMVAYSNLTGRVESRYRQQLLKFIPPMDRVFLRDFYDRQRVEMEKLQKKSSSRK